MAQVITYHDDIQRAEEARGDQRGGKPMGGELWQEAAVQSSLSPSLSHSSLHSSLQSLTRSDKHRQAGLWLGLLCSVLWHGASMAQSVPDGCLPEARVMRYIGLSCSNALPTPPTGFTVERLHDCSTIASLNNLAAAAPIPLQAQLESRVVVRKQCSTSPCQINTADFATLTAANFIEDELICSVVGMGDSKSSSSSSTLSGRGTTSATAESSSTSTTSGSSSTTSSASAPTDSRTPVTSIKLSPEVEAFGEYAQQTGAAVVVPTLTSYAAQHADSAYGLKVAVLDSGIDVGSSPDLPVMELGWVDPEMDTGEQGGFQEDYLGHGTSVAHLIHENAGGMETLVSVKVLDRTGHGSQLGLSRGLLVAAGPLEGRILNLSLAWHTPGAARQRMPMYLSEAFSAAYFHGARVVAAAGNRSHIANAAANWFYPAAALDQQDDMPVQVISVSGLNSADHPSAQAVGTGSSSEPIDLWAPSEHLCTATSLSAGTDGYERLSGTSFAAPQVSGSLVLFMAALGYASQGATVSTSSGAYIDQILPALRGTTDHHLDLCDAAQTLGFSITDCAMLAQQAVPGPDACTLPMQGMETVPNGGHWLMGIQASASYPYSIGLEVEGQMPVPVDQGVDAAWVDGLSSAPSRPVCTSCEYCPTLTTMNVSYAATGFDHHMVRFMQNGSFVYVPVPELSSFLNAPNLSGNILNTYPVMNSYYLEGLQGLFGLTEPWIVAQEVGSGAWSGQPLRTGC